MTNLFGLALAALLTVADLHPVATIATGGTPDWMAISPDSVWVANDALHSVQRIDVGSNRLTARVAVNGEPCSGLVFAFGSLWAPVCGKHPSLDRIDPNANAVTAVLPVRPQNSEGGITASGDSVWLATGDGSLSRIDPTTNRVRQRIPIPRGALNPLYAAGVVWVTSGLNDTLLAIDAVSGGILARMSVGHKPRFLTSGDGFIWTLNQGDGTVTKVDASGKRVVATIDAHIPGHGGEIAYGDGSVWATLIKTPLTRVDGRTNAILGQWQGIGGDAVRFGHASVWLTDYDHGRVWRIAPQAAIVADPAQTTYTLPNDVHWIPDTTKGVTPGSYYAYLLGKATDKCGWLVRTKFPDGFVYPWHTNHEYDVYTVLQGTLVIGFDKDRAKSAERMLPAGSVMEGLATEPHYGRAIGETIFDAYRPCAH